MNQAFTFLPHPRTLKAQNGQFHPQEGSAIYIKTETPQMLLFTVEQLVDTLKNQWGFHWPITASKPLPEDWKGLAITLDPRLDIHPQGYKLKINYSQIEILGKTSQGLFYGAQTLRQMIDQTQAEQLPCLNIVDWPDFEVRGVMLDVSRDKVYRLETLYMLVDELASWKVNQLQLYTEHTFAYQGHEVVWENASPMTPEDIQKLDRYCADRFIELVPNQNSLGHMTRWLKHPAYQRLVETDDPVQTPWGHIQKEPFSLAPVLPETLAFIKSLYDQLLPNFSSKQINVGCDEAFDIGAGKSKAAVEKIGKGQVYLNYLLALYSNLKQQGVQMQFWGDIILEHPELIPQLPKDAIALDWGYEGDHPFDVETKRFKESGIPFYVCPGTSAWNSLGGQVSNMLQNCRSAAQAGLDNGAIGYLNTDWGDNGHWQQLPISYPGLAAGAAFSWCLEENHPLNLEAILTKVIFRDSSGEIGKVLVTLGEEYQRWGLRLPNSSPLFWLLQERAKALLRFDFTNLNPVRESLHRLQSCLELINRVQFQREDAGMLQKELRLTVKMMVQACLRALSIYQAKDHSDPSTILYEIKGLMMEFQQTWLARNRVGGLTDSLNRFDVLLEEYQTGLESGFSGLI
jgi:hexosaminidase